MSSGMKEVMSSPGLSKSIRRTATVKAPPAGIELCGTNGCATIDAQSAEQLFSGGGTPRSAALPAPFYRLRWTWSGQEETGGYWLPDQNALRIGGWAAPDAAATA